MLEKTNMYREIIYKYTLKNVNLREGKSKNSKLLDVIPQGAKIELLDAEEDWLKVKYNSIEGYVYNEYISVTKYAWRNVNLREYPSVRAPKVAFIPNKSRVEVIGSSEGWSKVIYKNQEGWIFSNYLSFDGNKGDEINYRFFGTDMTKFVNDNKFESTTKYLLVTDLANKYTYVYEKKDNSWVQVYKWLCTVGKPTTPTIVGTFFISGRKPFFGTDKYRVKYATRIYGSYYYHSILYNPQGTEIIDGRLGKALSHGCIRLETSNAKWIYDNIPDGTTVFIH